MFGLQLLSQHLGNGSPSYHEAAATTPRRKAQSPVSSKENAVLMLIPISLSVVADSVNRYPVRRVDSIIIIRRRMQGRGHV